MKPSIQFPSRKRTGNSFWIFFICLLSGIRIQAEERGPLVLTTPPDYQVTALSNNGKWACGTYTNAVNMTYAFRWNLTTNEIVLLSGDDILSQADNISDEGVVVGQFDNTEATSNGAPIFTAGYWKDGAWHHLPNINDAYVDNQEGVGYAYSISPDGQYIGGSYNDAQSVLIPVIWKDGQIVHTFEGTGYDGMIYGISPDGKKAVGWTINAQSEGARVATLWEVGKGMTLLMDSRKSNAWCSGRTFSPNGRLVLFWEGYHDYTAEEKPYPESANMGIIAIYDTETGEKRVIPNLKDYPFNFDVYDITDAGTVVGYEQFESDYVERAIIYKDGRTRLMEDYLKEKGVDLEAQKQILIQSDSTRHELFRGIGISADEQTLAVLYYDTIGAIRTLVVKLDEDLTNRPPVQLKAKQLEGLGAAKLTWKEPLAGGGHVLGYNIYRDGDLLNQTLCTTAEYIDTGLDNQRYAYTVKAVYADGESEASDPAELFVREKKLSAPRNLYVRRANYANALVSWESPASNLIAKSYYEDGAEITGFGGEANAFEAAICLKSEELAAYAGNQIAGVTFHPLSTQQSWTLNIYTQSKLTTGAKLNPIYTQDLTETIVPGKENTVYFPALLPLPAGEDIYVALTVKPNAGNTSNEILGQVYGNVVPGYSDLARMLSEPELYSLYEAALADSYTYTTSWAISLLLTTDGRTTEADRIRSYRIYDGETVMGETESLSFLMTGLSAGEHTIGVEAVYTNGEVSPQSTFAFQMTPNEEIYKSITPSVTLTDDVTIRATWDVPTDNDETFITYAAEDRLQGGVTGPSESNYGYMASVIYDESRLKGYDGYEITALRFYPLAKADYTFFLKKDGKVIISDLYAETYTPNQWNVITLDEPVILDEHATYRLELDCWDVPAGQAPLGLDALPPFIGVSDLYSLDEGTTYSSIINASSYGNWMMGMVLQSPQKTPLPVSGYDVLVDGRQVNESPVKEPSYTYTFPTEDTDAHRLQVNVTYEVKGTVVGENTFFYIGTAGIEDVVYELDIRREGNSVIVCGDEVEKMTAYDLSGTCLKQVSEGRMDISGLPADIIILHVVQDGKVNVYKLRCNL